MLLMYCETCCTGSKTYRTWIDHLLSSDHQTKARNKIKEWSKEIQHRAIVFTEFCKPLQQIDKEVMTKLAWSVSECTIISDLYFNCEKQVCIILIDEEEGADYILNMVEIEAGDYTPFKQIATTIPENEWEDFFQEMDPRHDVNDAVDINAEYKPIIVVKDEPEVDGSNSEIHNNAESTCVPDLDKSLICTNADRSININDEFTALIKANTLSSKAMEMRKIISLELETIFRTNNDIRMDILPLERNLESLHFLKRSSIAFSIEIVGFFPRENKLRILNLISSAKIDGVCVYSNIREDIFRRGYALNFTHVKTNVEFQCFFYLKTLQRKLQLVAFCIEVDPRVLPLIQFLASWYEHCLNEVSDIKNQSEEPNKFLVYYPLIQLIIFFLIQCGILPAVTFGRKNRQLVTTLQSKRPIRPLNKCDVDPLTQSPSANCILKLAADFLNFFGRTDFQEFVVSLPMGELVRKDNIKYFRKYIPKFNLPQRNIIEILLHEGYIRFLKTLCRVPPSSLIIQDATDRQVFDFSNQWSPMSTFEFQKFSLDFSVVIQKILSGRSPLSNLWDFLPGKKTDDITMNSFGFVSNISTYSSNFFVPMSVKNLYKSCHQGVKRLFFTILEYFFDEVFEKVLKLRIKATCVENEEQQKQKLKHNFYNKETKTPSKKLKNVYQVNDSKVSLRYALSELDLPCEGKYVKTYSVQSRYSNILSSNVRKDIKSTIHPIPNDPLLLEIMVSDALQKQLSEDNTEMIFKILINCSGLVSGVQVETPFDYKPTTTSTIAETLSFVNDLAKNYILYRAEEFYKNHYNL